MFLVCVAGPLAVTLEPGMMCSAVVNKQGPATFSQGWESMEGCKLAGAEAEWEVVHNYSKLRRMRHLPTRETQNAT